MISAPGYATTHIYRSLFPRSSDIVNLRLRHMAEADRNAPAIAVMHRPRGYLDPARDKMAFDGQSRTVVAEFKGERVVGRSWPAREPRSVLELTY